MPDKKIIFVHIPRTSGTSIEKYLLSGGGINPGHPPAEEPSQPEDDPDAQGVFGPLQAWFDNLLFVRRLRKRRKLRVRKEMGIRKQRVKDPMKHLTARMLRQAAGEALWTESFKFAVVRNPWDRVVSLYHQHYFSQRYGKDAGCSLKEFLQQYTPAPWEHGFQCSDYLDEEVDFIVRFEHRTEDLARLKELSGGRIAVDDSVHERRSNRKKSDYREYYDTETIDMVASRYAEDIRRFGYRFE